MLVIYGGMSTSLQNKSAVSKQCTVYHMQKQWDGRSKVFWEWQAKVIEAASQKLDIVWERLRNYGDQPFKYQLSNTRYKSCPHIKSLEKL